MKTIIEITLENLDTIREVKRAHEEFRLNFYTNNMEKKILLTDSNLTAAFREDFSALLDKHEKLLEELYDFYVAREKSKRE